VLGLFSELFSLSRKQRELREVLVQTNDLRSQSDRLRAPLLADVRATVQEGDQLSAAPDPTDPRLLAERKKRLDELTDHFKKVSAALIPLGKEAVLLDAVRANFTQWKASTDSAYSVVFRSLALRLVLLVALIALVTAGSELWRRATFKYVRDLRRRQVSLLVRRIVVTVAVSIAVIFSLVSEIGSLATFAGFITAGLAVALQNMILSVAAYFFLIGKYGLRVGERVQIGNVIGDVLDIGLVRLHVMETGPDGLPTGRVVVFSNAVVFTGPNLFRPLPGTTFAWHQLKLTLATDTDHRLAEKRVLEAVSATVDDYRSTIERQHAEMAQSFAIPLQTPRPQSRLRLSEAGLEILVRYPVPLDEAAAADDRVTRAVLEAIEGEPRLKLVGNASATLQPVTS
jgi:small-conductance mechanosensitive channel